MGQKTETYVVVVLLSCLLVFHLLWEGHSMLKIVISMFVQFRMLESIFFLNSLGHRWFNNYR